MEGMENSSESYGINFLWSLLRWQF